MRTIYTRHLSAQALSALLERVASDAPCFVGVSDVEFRPFFVNRFGRRLVGLEDDFDVRALFIADFFVSEDRAMIRDVALPTLRRDGVWEGKYRFHHFSGGESVEVKWNAFILRDRTRAVTGAACITTGLTERIEAEARVRESARV